MNARHDIIYTHAIIHMRASTTLHTHTCNYTHTRKRRHEHKVKPTENICREDLPPVLTSLCPMSTLDSIKRTSRFRQFDDGVYFGISVRPKHVMVNLVRPHRRITRNGGRSSPNKQKRNCNNWSRDPTNGESHKRCYFRRLQFGLELKQCGAETYVETFKRKLAGVLTFAMRLISDLWACVSLLTNIAEQPTDPHYQ